MTESDAESAPILDLPSDQLALRLAAANGLIRRRRSIKPDQMSDAPVEDWILGNLLENANWAPTHGLTEPWRFRVYTGDSRETLGELLQRVYQEVTPDGEFREEKYLGLRSKASQAPVVIVICMKRQESEKIPEIEEVAAVACAVQNLHLSASAAGLGGYWSSPKFVYSEAMSQALELGPKDKCMGLFYLGWPKDPENWPEGKRQPIQDKLQWFE